MVMLPVPIPFRYLFFPLFLLLCKEIIMAQTVKDFDGNEYAVIHAGHEEWLAENLRVTHDPQGHEVDYYRIENPYMDSSRYGCLYSWSAAMDSSESPGAQGICPDGWHIPTDAEWDSLTAWAGGIHLAGVVLKRQGPGNFGVLMAGNYNNIQGTGYYFGEEAYYWSSSPYSATAAWMRHFGKAIKNINRSTVVKHYGFSIRCVREGVKAGE